MANNRCFNGVPVNTLYKKMYREAIPWADILRQESYNYLSLLSKSRNCPITTAMAGLLPLCAALVGPTTKVLVKPGYDNCLNMYTLGVVAANGGKSVINSLIAGICSDVIDRSGVKVLMEETTGYHRHIEKNGGYALVTSGEPHQIPGAVSHKKEENAWEMAPLSSLWRGRCPSLTLEDATIDSAETSFSMAILTRPSTCVAEFVQMHFIDDALVDRLMFMVDKPKLFPLEENERAKDEISSRYTTTLNEVFYEIFQHHKTNAVLYTFSEEARTMLDAIHNEVVEAMNVMYPTDSDSEEDPDTGEHSPSRNVPRPNSKEGALIARLAALLHILEWAFSKMAKDGNPPKKMKKSEDAQIPAGPLTDTIGLEEIVAAQKLFKSCQKQKQLFLDVIEF